MKILLPDGPVQPCSADILSSGMHFPSPAAVPVLMFFLFLPFQPESAVHRLPLKKRSRKESSHASILLPLKPSVSFHTVPDIEFLLGEDVRTRGTHPLRHIFLHPDSAQGASAYRNVYLPLKLPLYILFVPERQASYYVSKTSLSGHSDH